MLCSAYSEAVSELDWQSGWRVIGDQNEDVAVLVTSTGTIS